MKRIYPAWGLCLALALGSCTNEENITADSTGAEVIGFNVVSDTPSSRATPVTPGNITSMDFDVFAFTGNGTIFMGTINPDTGDTGVKIAYNGGKWNYVNPADSRYWPTETLNFYAISPATVDEASKGTYMYKVAADKQQITYATLNEFDLEVTPGTKNYDLMYAMALNQQKNTNAGLVNLNFHHILSQVLFKARTEFENMTVEIRDISISSVNVSGTFTLPAAADVVPTQADWTLNKVSTLKYYAVSNLSKTIAGTTGDWVSSEQTPILAIPQKLTKWVVSGDTKTKAQADAAHQSYLTISCKIQQNGAYLVGSGRAWGTIYVPFGADWEPGKRYIYTLIFGGGYDDNGNLILSPIEFEASVDDWTDVPADTDFTK